MKRPIPIEEILTFLGLDTNDPIVPPQDITPIPREHWQDCTPLLPPAAIARYLASGDILTAHTIDMLVQAMERAYGVSDPWFVDARCEGTVEDETLTVTGFTLLRKAEGTGDPLQDLIDSLKP